MLQFHFYDDLHALRPHRDKTPSKCARTASVGGLVGSCSVTFVRSVECRHGPLVPLLADIVILTITATLTMVIRGGATAPLKLRKTNRRALTKFHSRCYLWVCGDQKIWKLKISDGIFLIFPIFWKKNWKKSGKKFSKKNFFLLKFVFLS